jgi:hypothetical protein
MIMSPRSRSSRLCLPDLRAGAAPAGAEQRDRVRQASRDRAVNRRATRCRARSSRAAAAGPAMRSLPHIAHPLRGGRNPTRILRAGATTRADTAAQLRAPRLH